MKKFLFSFLVFLTFIFTINGTFAFEVKQVLRNEIDKIKCDLNFTGKLEKGFNYTFNDTFINSTNRDVKVIESEVHIYEEEDFNNSDFFSDVQFSEWAKKKNYIFNPGDNNIITELNDNYKIVKVPKISKQDNFIIKYTLGLYYKDSNGNFTDGPHYHTECKQYEIIGEKEEEINPTCNQIVLTKSKGVNYLKTKATCSFTDIKTYKIDCGNGDITTGSIDKFGNGTVEKTCIYKKPGNYKIACSADEKEINKECTSQVYVKKEVLDESKIYKNYNKYQLIKEEIKKIEVEENEKGIGLIKLPKVLPKTGTPISDRVKKLNNPKLDLDLIENRFRLAGSTNTSLDFWKEVLPEEDKNANKYIVIPSNGLVMPVNAIPNNITDYKNLISGREIEVNKYLKNGSMEYAGTSTNGYGKVGNKVIFAHSSYWKKDDGRYKTDFQKIIELDSGEEIWVYVKENGKFIRYKYKTISSYNSNPNNTKILQPGIGKNLTLFTCTPIGGIAGRWVVEAKYIDDYKIELENKIKFDSIDRNTKIKIINLVKKIKNDKKKILKIFNLIVKKEEQIANIKETEKLKYIKNILEYLKYKLAIEYYN